MELSPYVCLFNSVQPLAMTACENNTRLVYLLSTKLTTPPRANVYYRCYIDIHIPKTMSKCMQ